MDRNRQKCRYMERDRQNCRYILIIFLSVFGHASGNKCIISRDKRFADCANLGLTGIPNNLPSSLRRIDLSYNEIQNVTNGTFRRLINLRTIILDNNRIQQLEHKAFDGPTNLEILSLDNNLLQMNNSSFQAGVFRNLKNLRSLQLKNNRKDCFVSTEPYRYPDKEFSHLKNLRSLTVDLYPTPVFGIGFQMLTSLKILKFGKCCLRKLQNNTFENLSSTIAEIHMTNCYQVDINVDAGSFNKFKDLKVFNLRNTQISLPSALRLLHVFKNKTMDIINFHQVNSNLIIGKTQYPVILTESMFSSVKSICVKKLDLGYNNIVEVHINTLFSWGKHWECMEDLILSGNAFHIAGANSVELMFLLSIYYTKINLKIFEYSYAPVEFPDYFQPDSGYQMMSSNNKLLQKLYKKKTQFLINNASVESQHTSCDVWNGIVINMPPQLQTIRLSHVIAYAYFCNISFGTNKLQTVDVSYTRLDNFYITTKGLDHVTLLDLSGNDFTKSFPLFFKSVPNLKSLILKDAELDRVFADDQKQNLFKFITKVQNLNISNNHLTNLPAIVLKNMKNLQILNLSQNSLDTFPRHILDKENLTLIDLSNNRIVGLKKEITDIFDKKDSKTKYGLSLYLNGNTLLCTCDYMHFIQWIYETEVRLDSGRNYICTLGNGTRSTTKAVRHQFHDIFSECKSTFWLTFSIVFVCVFILILIGSIICFRLRWRIQYFFYRHFHYGYKPIRNDDSVYTYDAFVAYSGEDYKWITSTFRQKLETGHSLKLCLHDRDFEPGLLIQQNIINSICNSRKVIIDATPGYIKSKWFEFEIEMANIEMINRSYDNGIIVIIRKGTKPSDMPDLLKRLWNNITCVVLEDGEETDTFIERIVAALDK